METLKLFPEQEGIQYRAYMSSALTGFPSLTPEEEVKTRNEVLKLNFDIQKILKSVNIELYLPQESSNPASSHDDGLNSDEVYLLDRWRVAESDFMILNADNLSFGVGQEMEIANSIGIPTIIFFKKGKKVSRMIKGAPCIFIPDGYEKDESYIIYEDHSHLFESLKDRIETLKLSIRLNTSDRKKIGESFSKKLKDIRESKKLLYEDFAQHTGFSVSFIKLLETEKHFFDQLAIEKNLNNKVFHEVDQNKFSNPGLFVLETISNSLGIEITELLSITPSVFGFDHVDIYKEALIETSPNINQILQINKDLGFEFQRQAAFDGGKKLTKELIISKILDIKKNG